MRKNRSVPDATVIPVLIYPDVRAAVAWLTDVFGFVERVRIGDNHRSQLRFGDGAVIVADVRGDRRPHARARSPIPSWRAWRTPARTANEPVRVELAYSWNRPICPLENASTTPRTQRATSGRSPRRLLIWIPRNGVEKWSSRSDRTNRLGLTCVMVDQCCRNEEWSDGHLSSWQSV